MSSGCYLQGFAVSFCHDPIVFSFPPSQHRYRHSGRTDPIKTYVITCDSQLCAVLVHIWPDTYHALTRQSVMHTKEKENPQIFHASPNVLFH